MKDEGKVITVRGVIEPSELGVCLTHEHILFDWSKTYWTEPDTEERRRLATSQVTVPIRGLLNCNPFVVKDNFIQQDIGIAIQGLSDFEEAGGASLVEVTPMWRGRDPKGLKEVSERTGLNIIMSTSILGTSYYVESGHPPHIGEKSIDALAVVLVSEIVDGADGTNIRAGFMGNFGTMKGITSNEQKVLRAVARAHLQTGVAVSIHPDPSDRQALRVIRILSDEGVKPERMVMEHMDAAPDPDYQAEVAQTGVYLEFDTWGSGLYYGPPFSAPEPRDTHRAACLKKLIDRGHIKQLLIAQDVWLKQNLKKYGGDGHDPFLPYGAPRLKQLGVTDEQIRIMLVDNPIRLLPLAV